MVDVLKIISEERSRVETSLFSLVRFRALLSPLDRGLSSSSDFKSSKSISISGGASTFSWSSDGILLLFVGISGIGFCSSNLWTFLVIGGGRYERSSSIIVIPSRLSTICEVSKSKPGIDPRSAVKLSTLQTGRF
uniref:CSON012700 protein n=1 Tax=Culicoides sonorensis TaxID=179676 RepID=A0A336M674_CULSO